MDEFYITLCASYLILKLHLYLLVIRQRARRDVELIRQTTHTLKGAAATAAASGIADAARTLETLARENRLDEIDDAWARWATEVSALLRVHGPVTPGRTGRS